MNTRTLTAMVAIWVGSGACSPGPRWLAAGGDGTGRIVMMSFAATAADTLHVAANPQRPNLVRFGRDGASLFVLSAADPPVLLRLRRNDGRVLSSFGLTRRATTFALDRKGRRALVTGDGALEMIWLADGSRSRTLQACDGPIVELVAFDQGSRLFAICSNGAITEIDTHLEMVLRSHPAGELPCPPSGAALSRNGTILFVACAAPGRILYLDRVTLAVLDALDLERSGGRLIVDGHRGVVLGADELVLVDLQSRTIEQQLALPGAVRDAAVTPDGALLLLVSNGTQAALVQFDPARATLTEITRFDSPMRSVAAWPNATPVFNW